MDTATRHLFGQRSETIKCYVDILATQGIERGLIGPREGDRLWDRHIANSVAIEGLISPGLLVADVGSGGGLPGLPLAILRPDLEVTLIAPLLRRSTFLAEVVEELGLGDQVRVVRSRAEDHRGQYDVVTSRAVAPLGRLLNWCNPLRASHGQILAIKGSSAQDEVDAASKELRSRRLVAEVLVARAYPTAAPATVIRVTQAA